MGCLEGKKDPADHLRSVEENGNVQLILARIFLMRFISLGTINTILIIKEWLSSEIAALQVNSDSAGKAFP